MSYFPKLIAGGVAAAALLLGTAAAIASPGEATGSVNVRSGPGTQYAVLDTLHPGEGVDIGSCTGGWCHITHAGPDGWVSANYLSGDTAEISEPESYYYSPPVYDEEPIYDEPAPIFISPPFNHHRHFFNHPGNGHPHLPGVGFNPPSMGNGNVFMHNHDHMRGMAFNNSSGNNFVHRSFNRGAGAGLSCATDPSLCSGAGRSAGLVGMQPGNSGAPGAGHHRNGN